MTQTPGDMRTAAAKLWQWLFNPFRYLAGTSALVVGLAVITVTGLAGWVSDTHFDGVLDIHPGPGGPVWLFVGEGITNWICLSLMLVLAGLVVRRNTFRFVDVLGTQALARWPFVMVGALFLFPPVPQAAERVTEEAMKALQAGAPPAIGAVDMVLVLIMSGVILVSIVWTVALMYRAYAVSCDTRGAKAIVSFIIALIAAEVLSKLAVYALFVAAGVLAGSQA